MTITRSCMFLLLYQRRLLFVVLRHTHNIMTPPQNLLVGNYTCRKIETSIFVMARMKMIGWNSNDLLIMTNDAIVSRNCFLQSLFTYRYNFMRFDYFMCTIMISRCFQDPQRFSKILKKWSAYHLSSNPPDSLPPARHLIWPLTRQRCRMWPSIVIPPICGTRSIQ